MRDVNETNPGHLAQLLAMAPDDSAGWRADELRAILRHQLSVPVEFELPRDAGPAGDRCPWRQGDRLDHFGDLLRHRPRCGVLRASRLRQGMPRGPRGPLPREGRGVFSPHPGRHHTSRRRDYELAPGESGTRRRGDGAEGLESQPLAFDRAASLNRRYGVPPSAAVARTRRTWDYGQGNLEVAADLPRTFAPPRGAATSTAVCRGLATSSSSRGRGRSGPLWS